MNKIINNLLAGMTFSIIPIVYMIVVSEIGSTDFFKFIFLCQLTILSFIGQGFLVNKFRGNKI